MTGPDWDQGLGPGLEPGPGPDLGPGLGPGLGLVIIRRRKNYFVDVFFYLKLQ